MAQTQVGEASLLEERLSGYQHELLPGVPSFEAFLKQMGKLSVTVLLADRITRRLAKTECNVLLDGKLIGIFRRVYYGAELQEVEYCGTIPGVVNEKIRLSYYLHNWNASSTGFYQINGFLVPFPGRTAEK